MRSLTRLLAFSLPLLSSAAFAAEAADPFASMPMQFEQDAHGRWTAQAPGAAFLVEPSGVKAIVNDRMFGLTFDGGARGGRVEAESPLGFSANYFHADTYRSAKAFGKLRRRGVYPGIDVVYYGTGRHLEYDFVVAPGASPSAIRLRVDAAETAKLDEAGRIAIRLGDREVLQLAPAVYQRRDSGELVAVRSSYRSSGDGVFAIDLDDYDPSRELVVDPQLVYYTPIGGSDTDAVTYATHDVRGFLYLGGYTYSPDFPFGPISYSIFVSARDAFVMKMDPFSSGSIIKYSTFYGGSGNEDLHALAVDKQGYIYFTGTTLSGDLPMVNGGYSYEGFLNTNDHPYIAVLDSTTDGPTGLIFSTYFGGSGTEHAEGLTLAGGLIYIAGWTNSPDLPTVGAYYGALTGSYDAFIAVFDPTQQGTGSLVAGTFFGGTGQDMARTIAVDSNGLVWIAGFTYSYDLPTTPNAFSASQSGGGDVFIAQIDMNGATLDYATYLGGSGFDEAKRLIVEPSGRIAVAGYTLSPDLPIAPNAAQPVYGGNSDAFIAVVDPTVPGPASLYYSTFFGGSDGEVAYGFSRDAQGRYYIAGYTLSLDMPTTPGALSTASTGLGLSGFVTAIDPTKPSSNAVFYSSYFTSAGYQVVYGLDVDSSGLIYVGGVTTSVAVPNQPPARNGDGNYDGFLVVIMP